MRIVEVHLEGFGRLVGRHFHLGPGLNLFLGGNGAGKSTLQRAMLALLYGFGQGEQDLVEALRPWHEPAFFGGSLTCVLDDGQGFRLVRRFLPASQASLHTYPEGEDVSSRYLGEAGQLRFAEEHLSLGREAFARACCLLKPADGVPGLGPRVRDALLRLAIEAPADATTALAITHLQKALDELTSTREGKQAMLAVARERLAVLLEERRRAQQARRQRISQVRALRQAAERIRALDLRRSQLADLREQTRLQAAGLQAGAAAELAAEIRRCQEEAARWQAWASFPAHLRDEVLRLSAERKHLQKECALAEARAGNAQETLQALTAQEAAIVERLGALGGGRSASPGDPSRLQKSIAEWRAASDAARAARERCKAASSAVEAMERRLAEEGKPLQAVLALGLAGLAAVQQRLQAARQRQARAKTNLTEATSRWVREGKDEEELERALGTKGGDGAEKRSLLPLALRPGRRSRPRSKKTGDGAEAAYADLVACRAEADAAQRAMREIEATTFWQLGDLLGGTLEDSAFAQLSERLQRYLQSVAEVEQQKLALTELQAEEEQASRRREHARQALQAELASLGFEADDLDAALAASAAAAEPASDVGRDRSEWERVRLRSEADLELVRLRASALQSDLRAWRDKQMAVAAVEASLDALFSQAGIASTPSTIDQALEAFEQGYENYQRWEKAKAALEAAMRYRRALVGVHEEPQPEALPGDSGTSRRAAPDSGSHAAGEGQTDRSSGEHAAELAELERERAAATEEYERLEASIRQAGGSFRHPAEVEEEVASLHDEVERLEQYRQALEMARDALADASVEHQKQFVPKLEGWLREGLSRLLDQQDVTLSLDPEALSSSLHVPGIDRALPAEILGAGTCQLIDLLLGAGVARLVGYAREKPPLLLDEPLAHCDRERQQKALDLLLQLAEDLQVLFFTREERFADWLEQRCGASSLHQVQVLA
ncbi:MAG: AAA family ATPase [Anaerolineae bacterium]|nr:AAA family ATPase [Anaerolineae bacterium]